MQKILTAGQIRRADAFTIEHEPISSIDLMEGAAFACYKWIAENTPDKKNVVIVCGTGNNGGDGLALARMLSNERHVEVFILHSDKSSDDFKTNLERLNNCNDVKINTITPQETFYIPQSTDILIDAVFGTGLSRPAKGWYADVLTTMNNHRRSTHIAIDIPSGLFADTPTPPDGTIFEADITLTFQFAKLSFLFAENYRFVGDFVVLPIGLSPQFTDNEYTPYHLTDDIAIPEILLQRPKFSHKGTYGHCLLIAGSYGKMGAAILSAKACLRTGAGLVTAHVPKNGVVCMQTAFPEAIVSIDNDEQVFSAPPEDLSRYNTVAIGPGIGTSGKTVAAIGNLFEKYTKPVVIDADAINCIALDKSLLEKLPENSILTPHHKELERLVGPWENGFERLEIQRQISQYHKVTIIFKGAHTSVSLPDGKVFFNTTGNAGMATAGSGDVLTGIIAGLMAQGIKPEMAAIYGVFLHGKAGDRAFVQKGLSLIASDIVENICNICQSPITQDITQ